MEKRLYIKEPGSAITHFIGMIMAIIAAIPLLYRAAREPSKLYIVSLTIYAASLILLYAASTTYHTFDISEKVNTVLKKIDHMMISVLIAGSYTPVCLLVIGGRKGITLLCIVWAFAIVGILIKAFWVFCPKWVSSVLYIGMGWTCVLAFSTILGWNLFAKINVVYLFGPKAKIPFIVIALVFIFLGTMASNTLVWDLSDMFNQLMVIPNALALFALTGVVVDNYKKDTGRK